jgi:CheY-like chemotaxis protein
MDPLLPVTSAVALVGAELTKKCGGAIAEQAFAGRKALLKCAFGHDPEPDDLSPEKLQAAGAEANPEMVRRAREVVQRSPVLRRAQLVRPALEGARALWVDDHPRNNAFECRTLMALGVAVETVTTTKDALARVRGDRFDVILSDMARSRPDSGLNLLRSLREAGCQTEVVFYVGRVDPAKGVPVGAFGIADKPQPLLHLVLDVLERHRL